MAAHQPQGQAPASLFSELTRFCREGLCSELRYALYYEKEISVHVAGRTLRGNTLLHEAAECDQPDIVQLLLIHGFSPNVRAKAGLTPLHIAASKGYVGCVKALLENNADVTLRDDVGHDAFMKAERSKKKDEIQRLLASKGELSWPMKHEGVGLPADTGYPPDRVLMSLLHAHTYGVASRLLLAWSIKWGWGLK